MLMASSASIVEEIFRKMSWTNVSIQPCVQTRAATSHEGLKRHLD